MERLTKRLSSGAPTYNYPASCYFGDDSGPDRIAQSAFRQRCVERLADYEDTGRTPEEVTALGNLFDYALEESKTLTEQLALLNRIRELAEADKNGCVIIVPCKVGDTVYRLFVGNPDNPVIATLKINTVAEAVKLIGKMGMHKYIGTFLTREEAEKALEAMEGK